jgi:enoyl-CoA hydratase/carnithine racemase
MHEEQKSFVEIELVEVDGMPRLGVVVLNRSSDRNPLDWQTVRELSSALSRLGADPDIRLIAITGSGEAFSAGGDLKRYRSLQRDADQFQRYLADLGGVIASIGQLPQPCIALINGIALAGGLELILACDFAIAAESAMIGDAHQVYGQMGGAGALTLLPAIVGPMRARELLFTGRLLTAAEALDWGLVSSVVPDNSLRQAAVEVARVVMAKSPLAIANAKRVLNASLWAGVGLTAGLAMERAATALYCITSEAAPEGLAAFAEKRLPRWTGR